MSNCIFQLKQVILGLLLVMMVIAYFLKSKFPEHALQTTLTSYGNMTKVPACKPLREEYHTWPSALQEVSINAYRFFFMNCFFHETIQLN